MPRNKYLIIVDSHVHIHPCFNFDKFLHAAYQNFWHIGHKKSFQSPSIVVLIVTQGDRDLSFNELANIADAPNDTKRIGLEDWKIHRTTEAISLRLAAAHGRELYIIAGKQLRSSERLEILAVGNDLPEADATPFCDLLNSCLTGEADRIIIIPWGFGKWTGRRRQLIEKTIENADPEFLYFAENGNRLKFWPQAGLLKHARNRGFRILSGSDPLPFKSEEGQAGSHGFMISGDFDPQRPFQSIHQLLKQLPHSESIELFGRGQNLLKFLRNQVAMQFRRHFA